MLSNATVDLPTDQTALLEEVGRRLSVARSVVVLTGAGISVESGLATFRDPDGLWNQFRPEDLAHEGAFRSDPALVQEWYAWRRAQAEASRPNPGHTALVQIERAVSEFVLVTQNVDGLHRRAGNQRLIELHGTITEEYCIDCRQPAGAHEAGRARLGDDMLRRCAACNGLLRPAVVWFGESLPDGAFEQAAVAAKSADVFLSVGTSAVVYPAASLPLIAKERGAYVVEINVKPSAVASVLDAVLLGPAGELLPRLVRLAGLEAESRHFEPLGH